MPANPFDPFGPRPPRPAPPPAPVGPAAGLSRYAKWLPWVVVAALGAYVAWERLGGGNAPDPAVVAGREYAKALGPAWADSLAAHLSAVRSGGDPKAAKDAAFKAASEAAFTSIVLPVLTRLAPAGPDAADPAALAAYAVVSEKLQKGARGQ